MLGAIELGRRGGSYDERSIGESFASDCFCGREVGLSRSTDIKNLRKSDGIWRPIAFLRPRGKRNSWCLEGLWFANNGFGLVDTSSPVLPHKQKQTSDFFVLRELWSNTNPSKQCARSVSQTLSALIASYNYINYIIVISWCWFTGTNDFNVSTFSKNEPQRLSAVPPSLLPLELGSFRLGWASKRGIGSDFFSVQHLAYKKTSYIKQKKYTLAIKDSQGEIAENQSFTNCHSHTDLQRAWEQAW